MNARKPWWELAQPKCPTVCPVCGEWLRSAALDLQTVAYYPCGCKEQR